MAGQSGNGAPPASGGGLGLRDSGLAVLVMAIWGYNFVVAKTGLTELPPIFMMGLRFAFSAALLVPFVAMPRGRMKEIAALSVVLGAAHFSMMFTGLKTIDASTAAIAIQLQVPFSALLATVLLNDPPGWRRMAGIAVAFGGVVLIAGEPRFAGNLWALGLVIGAAFVWAVGNIQVKQMGRIDEMALLAWMSVMAAPQLFLLSWMLEDGQFAAAQAATWRGWGAVAYQAVAVVAISYGIWYRLLGRHSVNAAVPYTLLVPVFGVASAAIWLDETLTARIVIGGAITIVGVTIIILRRPHLADPLPDAQIDPVEDRNE
jgi:O-acetylserine/cysteine efflux transporter